jgi:hypothetical protein
MVWSASGFARTFDDVKGPTCGEVRYTRATPSPNLRDRLRNFRFTLIGTRFGAGHLPYTARTSTTPGTALMAPAICGLTL